jgi:hypothetical protein
VTSRRQRKRQAQALGLTEAELKLCDLLGEVLEALRWNQILGFSNQYLLQERLQVPVTERTAVMRAAAAEVERSGRLQDWGQRLLEVQASLRLIHARLSGETARKPAAGTEAMDAG